MDFAILANVLYQQDERELLELRNPIVVFLFFGGSKYTGRRIYTIEFIGTLTAPDEGVEAIKPPVTRVN